MIAKHTELGESEYHQFNVIVHKRNRIFGREKLTYESVFKKSKKILFLSILSFLLHKELQ